MAETETPVPVMDQAPDQALNDAGPSSVGDALRALVEDGQTLLEAEIAYRKAQAAFGLGEAKVIALLLVLGLAFGFFTLMALVVGLLLALAFHVGVWGALAIVGGSLLALTALSLLMAAKRMGSAKAGLLGKDIPS